MISYMSFSCAYSTHTLFFFCLFQPEDISILFSKELDPSVSSSISSVAVPPPDDDEQSENPWGFPGDFEPLRSEQLAKMNVDSSPVFRNPYMSPLLAPDHMLKGLPPVHIVVREF